MKKNILTIRINKNDITFIDLFKNGSSLPEYSFICKNNYDIKSALNTINLLDIKYLLHYERI